MQRARRWILTLVPLANLALSCTAWAQRRPEVDGGRVSASAALASVPVPPPPDVLFGELFRAVQMAELFADQKVFPDAIPLFDPEQILADYTAERAQAGFDLRAFVEAHFALPEATSITPPEKPVAARAHRMALARAHPHHDERGGVELAHPIARALCGSRRALP
jgi:neutral trehalase